MPTIGQQQIQEHLGKRTTVLFSYKTPVACGIPDGHGGFTHFRTDHKWSVTTSKHISHWLSGAVATLKPQAYFDELGGI